MQSIKRKKQIERKTVHKVVKKQNKIAEEFRDCQAFKLSLFKKR